MTIESPGSRREVSKRRRALAKKGPQQSGLGNNLPTVYVYTVYTRTLCAYCVRENFSLKLLDSSLLDFCSYSLLISGSRVMHHPPLYPVALYSQYSHFSYNPSFLQFQILYALRIHIAILQVEVAKFLIYPHFGGFRVKDSSEHFRVPNLA